MTTINYFFNEILTIMLFFSKLLKNEINKGFIHSKESIFIDFIETCKEASM